MIGGFIIRQAPGTSTSVIVRAIGLSLTQFGVANDLADRCWSFATVMERFRPAAVSWPLEMDHLPIVIRDATRRLCAALAEQRAPQSTARNLAPVSRRQVFGVSF